MRPLLEIIQDRQSHAFSEALKQVCDHFSLTEEERVAKIDSGKSTVIKNRVGWARTYLKKAGLLDSPEKGFLQITSRGLEALSQPAQIDREYLKQFPEFLEFITPKKKASPNQPDLVEQISSTPEEQLESAYDELNNTLASDLLDQIKEATPAFFEQLVVDLMIAMGYGGSRKEAGSATQYTNDGGIDGIIKEDPLGLDVIYLQAKRYKDNNIQRPEIDAFIGALTRRGARKGVFITTSQFSQGALDAVEGLNLSIILIDGLRLAELMVAHNLGVSVKETYQIKTLDNDYFSED
jgi:restriction system protein